ncbi:hypothetical protein GCM10007989_28600 [Devosia pacifica]|uniref:Uncharacterized protein n=1 Tax=Devosia pacifica TaxID=1335967 RepID=A0A918SBW5_9HYPH|nr:hypothetical protein GCM10007989_28600 [Devosia pacifica]
MATWAGALVVASVFMATPSVRVKYRGQNPIDVLAGLLARGVFDAVSAFPAEASGKWRRLTAYSCGGSHGFGP